MHCEARVASGKALSLSLAQDHLIVMIFQEPYCHTGLGIVRNELPKTTHFLGIEKCRIPPDAVLLPVSFEEMALPKPEALLSKWFLDRTNSAAASSCLGMAL